MVQREDGSENLPPLKKINKMNHSKSKINQNTKNNNQIRKIHTSSSQTKNDTKSHTIKMKKYYPDKEKEDSNNSWQQSYCHTWYRRTR